MAEDDRKICETCQRIYATPADFLRQTSRWRVCSMQHLWFNCACGSTLLLKKGKYPWYSIESSLSNSAGSIFELLRERSQLPYVKNKIILLQEKLKNPDVDLSMVARELKTEPLLASNIINIAENMQTADKSVVNEKGRDDQLTNAVVFIGQNALEDVLLVAFLKSVEIKTHVFNAEDFWKGAQGVASISEFLCRRFAPQRDESEAYMAGFLCNVGKIVSAFYFPKQADTIQTDLNDHKIKGTWLRQERIHEFYDHRVLGEIAAAFWGFPKTVLEGIQGHHNVEKGSKSRLQLSEIIAFANQLEHWNSGHPELINDFLMSQLLRRFKLKEADVEKLLNEFHGKGARNAA